MLKLLIRGSIFDIVAPPQQQVLRLPITSISECDKVYGQTLPISDEQVCAGGEQGNDACSGFGGAPLLVRHGDTHYQVRLLLYFKYRNWNHYQE